MMRAMLQQGVIAVLLLLSSASWLMAASGESDSVPFKLDASKPINLAADRVSFDNKLQVVRWIGNVVATQDKVKLSAEMILIYFEEKKKPVSTGSAQPDELIGGVGAIKSIVATGGVVIMQEDKKATCDQAVFDQKKSTVTLEGNPELFSGQDRLVGNKIIVNIKEQRVEVIGGASRRVQATVLPKSGQGAVLTPQAEKRLKDLEENPPVPKKEDKAAESRKAAGGSDEDDKDEKDDSLQVGEPTP